MPRAKDEKGRFKKAIARKQISVRLLPEIADKLRRCPNRNRYIEAVLMEKIALLCAAPDPAWDYIEDWDRILDLFLFAGSALLAVQQCEEKCSFGDDAIAQLEKDIENWLKMRQEKQHD